MVQGLTRPIYTPRALKALFIIQGANAVIIFQMIFGLFAIMDHAEENEIKVVEFNSSLGEKIIIKGCCLLYICFKRSTQML